MKVQEILEGVTTAWQRQPGKTSRKYRCQSGPRKGRVMASPASCNKPLSAKKSATLKKTKSKMGRYGGFKRGLTKRRDPHSRRLRKLNK